MNALNPVMRMGAQMADAMRDHDVAPRDIDALMARGRSAGRHGGEIPART